MFIGYGVAKTLFDINEEPTTIYLRANPTFIEDVVEVLAPSMNPENPDQVEVTRPSDALEAQQAAEEAFTNLLLGVRVCSFTGWRGCYSQCYGHVCSRKKNGNWS